METVIKVSGNKHAEDVKAEKAEKKAEAAEKEKEKRERGKEVAERGGAAQALPLPPAPPPPPETVVDSIIHHSWGHRSTDPKDIPVVRGARALCVQTTARRLCERAERMRSHHAALLTQEGPTACSR